MKVSLLFVGLLSVNYHLAQPIMSLESAISNARSTSAKAKLASTSRKLSLYRYENYTTELKPQISFVAGIPGYNKDYLGVRQPNGTIEYKSRTQTDLDFGFNLSQRIAGTGGTLSLQTYFSRFDDYLNDAGLYNASPLFVRYEQSLFGINDIKWKKKIEPLKLTMASKEYSLIMESIAQQVTEAYFDVLLAQNDIAYAQANQKAIQELKTIEDKRIPLGTGKYINILQLRSSELNTRQVSEQARYKLQTALLTLIHLGAITNRNVIFEIPTSIPDYTINENEAILKAKEFRPEFLKYEIQKLETQRDIADANAQKRSIDLYASFGINNAAAGLNPLFANLRDQQRFNIGINIPVVDWGRRETRVKSAQALAEFTAETNSLEENNITQEIQTLVANLALLRSNIDLAKEGLDIANERYNHNFSLFQTGQTTLTELNLAQREKDQANINVVNANRQFWVAHYLLRRSTLYDFAAGKRID
jgi:hypothetical protein